MQIQKHKNSNFILPIESARETSSMTAQQPAPGGKVLMLE